MDKRKLGAGGACAIALVLLLIATLGYFIFSPAQVVKISDKIEGDKNVLVNTAHREVSLVHIENLGNQVSDLKDNMQKHHAIKYGLLIVMFVMIAGYMIQRCKNISMKMKQKMEKQTQDEKIENHEDALIEMGF